MAQEYQQSTDEMLSAVIHKFMNDAFFIALIENGHGPGEDEPAGEWAGKVLVDCYDHLFTYVDGLNPPSESPAEAHQERAASPLKNDQQHSQYPASRQAVDLPAESKGESE